MSRKDYVAIADVLATEFATGAREVKLCTWRLTLSIADKFAADNPRFDRSRFYLAVFGTSDHFAARDHAAMSLPAAVRAA